MSLLRMVLQMESNEVGEYSNKTKTTEFQSYISFIYYISCIVFLSYLDKN